MFKRILKRVVSSITWITFVLTLNSIGLICSSNVLYANAASNEETIFNYVTNEMGMNCAAGCAVLANVYAESSFNPNLWGDGGTSYGICQWHNSRFTRLKTYCSNNGFDYTSLKGQLHYLEYELKNYYPSVYNKLVTTSNSPDGAYEAASYWCIVFEVPDDKYTKAVYRGNLAKNTYWTKYSGTINEHPIGYLDSYGTDGRNVNVSGWTYDPSSPSSQLAVHIYLEDSGGGMHCIGALTADQIRSDVNNVYGCGDYHGYEGSGSAVGLAAGEYTVQVAYLDVEDGGNGATWVSGGTVTINPDSEGPSISDVKIVDISKDGYTVQCTAEDSSGVSNVRFPTWTDYNDQDDIIWGDGTSSENIWSYRVNITDHNNEHGAYITHIYAYDNAGNQSSAGISAYLEDTAPIISNVTVSDISASGYTVKCTVTDEGGSGLDRVQFPTWTTENNQDDIQPSWEINQTASGIIDGDTVTYRVNISDHNNEIGCYRTHIYAYDKSGNASCVAVDDVILENVPPTISNVRVTDIDDTGYTVQCTVTDEGTGVDHVAFPTWTISINGQDDLQSGWEQSEKCAGTVESDGKTYTYRVNISDHNNEKGCYRTHIYAWDKSGNMAYCTSGDQLNYVMFDDDNPAIYNIKITNIDKTGYTISCDIRNDIDIDRVQFPTWTDYNGQDDIQTDWTINEDASGTPIGNTYIYRVKVSNHNNELGPYITHIYAYDTAGNYYHVSTGMDAAGLHRVTLNKTIEMPSGDVNCDGRFNVSDVVLLQKWLLSVPNTHLANWQAANFCEDDRLDVFDLCLMKRKLIYR